MKVFYILLGRWLYKCVCFSNTLNCTLEMGAFYCMQLYLEKYTCTIFISIKNRQSLSMEVKVNTSGYHCQQRGWVVVMVILTVKGQEGGSLLGVLGMFCILILMVVAWIYTFDPYSYLCTLLYVCYVSKKKKTLPPPQTKPIPRSHSQRY